MASRYTDQTLLRRSHDGDLYRATDSNSGAEVILRRMFDAETVAVEPERVSQLESRASKLAAIQHSNVAAILGSGSDDDGAYIVSQWVEGDDLTSIVSQAALTPEDFSTVARNTLDGLAVIHDHGMIHGSLRPDRIVAHWQDDDSLQFIITELEIAELQENANVVTTDHRGTYNGALDCMAPELFSGLGGDARSDIYSLGNVFYYALTQVLPYAAYSAAETIKRHQAGGSAPVSDIREDISVPLSDWVAGLLARDPEKRPQSATEAREAFERAINGETPFKVSPAEVVAEPEEATTPGTDAQTKIVTTLLPTVLPDTDEDEGEAPAAQAEAAEIGETEQDAGDDESILVEPTVTPSTTKVSVSAIPDFLEPDSDFFADQSTEPKERAWIMPTIGGLAAIGLGALVWFQFLAPPADDGDDSSGKNTNDPSPIVDPDPTAAASPASVSGDPSPAAGRQPSGPATLTITDGLLGRFAFDEIADEPATTAVNNWPKQGGAVGIGSLLAAGVDEASGSTVRKTVATPLMFPALNDAHSLLQLTGDASLNTKWLRDNEGFLTGDQLTCIVVFWTPEKDAHIVRLHPPLRDEAEISAAVMNRQLISKITYLNREFPIIPFPHGNQLIAHTLTWTGPQDNVIQSVMTASGARYDSRLAEAPNLALLISSLTVGGNTAPLSNDVPSGVYLAELLLYDRALSKQERASVDAYLNQKYFR